jgi:hypothetical protein
VRLARPDEAEAALATQRPGWHALWHVEEALTPSCLLAILSSVIVGTSLSACRPRGAAVGPPKREAS